MTYGNTVRVVPVVSAIFQQQWKTGRKILVIKFGDLTGQYAFDIDRDELYGFGPGGGIRRKPLGWHAVNPEIARRLFMELTERGRKINHGKVAG